VNILLDENVPAPLRRFFPNDPVATVQQLGWGGIENGELVDLADSKFDVLVLADKNLRYQQNLIGRKIALVELSTNRWPALKAIVQDIVSAVQTAKAGSYVIVPGPV
jgi:predicted nuclease of predicted toxin-antitoxin system